VPREGVANPNYRRTGSIKEKKTAKQPEDNGLPKRKGWKATNKTNRGMIKNTSGTKAKVGDGRGGAGTKKTCLDYGGRKEAIQQRNTTSGNKGGRDAEKKEHKNAIKGTDPQFLG